MRVFSASLSLLFALAVAGVTTPASAQSIRALNRVGFDAELAEEYDLAEDMWRQIGAQDPGNANTYVYLGNVLLAQEKWAEAEGIFREGIALLPEKEPTEPEALYLGLGAALRAQGQSQSAKAALETAIQTNDQVPFGYRALGRLLRDYGELDGAADAFNAIIQLEPVAPHGSEAFWDLGKVRAAQGQLEAAEREYRRAIALEPDRVDFHRSLAALLRRQGRTQAASQVTGEILRLNNETAALRAQLEEQPLKQAFGTEAYRAQRVKAQALIDQYPEMVQAHLELGAALLKLGQFAESVELLTVATELNPDNPLAHYLLSLALTDVGEDVRSEAAYQTALALYPEIGPPGVFREVSTDDFGPVRQTYVGYIAPALPLLTLASRATPVDALPRVPAIPNIQRSRPSTRVISAPRVFRSGAPSLPLASQIALNPDDGRLQLLHARNLQREGKSAEAIAAFQSAARLDPSQAYVAYNDLGRVLVEQEQFDEAIAAFFSALDSAKENAPSNADSNSIDDLVPFAEGLGRIYDHLGALLRKQGRWAEALAIYNEAAARVEILPEKVFVWEQYARESLLSLARSNASAGEYSAAEAAYREAIALYPDAAPTLLDELGTVLFDQGKLQAAESIYMSALRDYPDNSYRLSRSLEFMLRAQNRSSEADALIADYPPVATLFPAISLPPTLRTSARATPMRSLPSPRPVSSRFPTSTLPLRPVVQSRVSANPFQTSPTPLSAAYDDFGRMRFSQGRYSHAEYAFGTSLSSSPYHLSTLVAYGLSFGYQGDRDRAAEIFNRAFNTEPDDVQCYLFPADGPTLNWQPEDYLQVGEACLPVLLD